MAELVQGREDAAETRQLLAASVGADECRLLAAGGGDEFHFYPLNRADLTYAISKILGLRPNRPPSPAPGARPLVPMNPTLSWRAGRPWTTPSFPGSPNGARRA